MANFKILMSGPAGPPKDQLTQVSCQSNKLRDNFVDVPWTAVNPPSVLKRKSEGPRYRSDLNKNLISKQIEIQVYLVEVQKWSIQSDTDETLGVGLKVSVLGPIPGLGLGLSLNLAHFWVSVSVSVLI